VRRVGHPELDLLIEIENTLLVEREHLLHRSEAMAQTKNWNLGALREYVAGMPPPLQKPVLNNYFLFKPVPALLLSIIIYTLVGLVLFALNNNLSTYAVTNRTVAFAVFMAGPGAILRWHLSKYNGMLGGAWSWFPYGTFLANMMGSVISIAMVTWEFIYPAQSFWPVASMRAVKIGFAGSLTTVSTFVKEVHGFHADTQTTDQAYIYLTITLAAAATLGMMTYSIVVFGFSPA